MTAARKLELVSVQDYLAGELRSPIKHEYLGGVVYAMAGARNVHNKIAMRITSMLYSRLEGQLCQPFNSDTKIRVRLGTHERYYYPDASVVCQENSDADSFQDSPVVVFEVLSKKTRRTDEGEKKDAYLSIPSLQLYVLVEQESPALIAFRRTGNGFVREVYQGTDAILPLPEIGADLQLAEIYKGLRLTPEEGDELE